MAAACPYCQHRLALRWPRPGRHELRCPQCAGSVAIVVPDHPTEAWTALPAPQETQTDSPARPRTLAAVRTSALAAGLGIPPASIPPLPPADDDTPPPPSVPVLPLPNSPRSASSVPGEEADDDTQHVAKLAHLPGYRIERAIGYGGMGTVFLARQLSLDRPVALKVMSRKWTADPVFTARFIREAYAAALLSHPNVVQIYDIGEDNGTRFFSMEYVPGRSLADVVKVGGRIDPETAVGYVLQAARGLKHAHDRGMIHRDVKPDNLLLTDNGLVKVADLGLVKTPEMAAAAALDVTDSGSGLRTIPPNMTGTQIALGTPAYMAPEQCRDAATVDHRADVYSLGCTLYVLVTGKPPFDGNTAVELMTQHAYKPLVPPDQVSGRVPKELSAIIQRMMAKDPNDRYATMGEVIRVLEQWLGVHHAGTFSPRDEQIAELEECARAFQAAPAVVLRRHAVAGFLTACSLAAVVLMFFGQLPWAFGLAGLVLQSAAVYFVLNGVARRTYFFRRVRQFAGGMSGADWVVVIGGVGLFTALLGVLGLLDVWLGFGAAGVALAVLLRVGIDRTADRQRAVPLARCHQLLRRLRLNGVDEEELRLFAAKYAGRDWEEFFEALFGFEPKLATRAVLLRGESAGHRETFAAWREPILGLIDRVEAARKESRERGLLERVERARLVAAGVGEQAARDRAAVVAAAVVDRANEYREVEEERAAGFNPAVPNLGPIAGRGSDPRIDLGDDPPGRLERALSLLISTPVRAVLAAVCLAGFLLWVYQNGLFADPAAFAPPGGPAPLPREVKPLHVNGLPPAWTGWCDSANIGWAGFLLLASLYYRGGRTGALAVAGAALTAFGHKYGLQPLGPIGANDLGVILGTALLVLGFRLGKR